MRRQVLVIWTVVTLLNHRLRRRSTADDLGDRGSASSACNHARKNGLSLSRLGEMLLATKLRSYATRQSLRLR